MRTGIQGRIVVPKPELAAERIAPDQTAPQLRQGGVSMDVSVADALAAEPALTRLRRQVYALLCEPTPLSITVSGLGFGPGARCLLSRLCIALRWTLNYAQVSSRRIELVLPALALPPATAWTLRRQLLGPGALYIIADGSYFEPHRNRRDRSHCDAFWQQVWQLRGETDFNCVYAPMVSSPCPLLSNEVADAVQAPLALQVPVGTAWAWTRVDLALFADSRGRIDACELNRQLKNCVDAGEQLHDRARWPTPSMQADSWRNRRLAIAVTGIGDIVRRRKSDPRKLTCLDDVCELLESIREGVVLRSRALAESKAIVPALDANDPLQRLLPGNSAGWPERWQRALEKSAVRHRNLLALSPWSVLPAAESADARYFDLLPALAYADACAFGGRPRLKTWKINEFIELHNRARAVLEQNDARRLIAKQV